MAKLRFNLTNRDRSILRFLWRWKVVSSSALFYKFYPTMKGASAYKKLLKLRDRKLIKPVHLGETAGHAWTLNDLGYKYLLPCLPELSQKGYKSDTIYHDFITSAFHIGCWLDGLPDNCEIFSEQQIKRYHPDFYPPWLPVLETHRPDGYWNIHGSNGQQVISLEIEISEKAKGRYQKVKDFYDYFESIKNVVWVTSDLPMAKRLLNRLSDSDQKQSGKHHFLLLNDILKNNWAARFVLGEHEGTAFNTFMQNLVGNTWGGVGLPPPHPMLLDTNLYKVSSDTYRPRAKTK